MLRKFLNTIHTKLGRNNSDNNSDNSQIEIPLIPNESKIDCSDVDQQHSSVAMFVEEDFELIEINPPLWFVILSYLDLEGFFKFVLIHQKTKELGAAYLNAPISEIHDFIKGMPFYIYENALKTEYDVISQKERDQITGSNKIHAISAKNIMLGGLKGFWPSFVVIVPSSVLLWITVSQGYFPPVESSLIYFAFNFVVFPCSVWTAWKKVNRLGERALLGPPRTELAEQESFSNWFSEKNQIAVRKLLKQPSGSLGSIAQIKTALKENIEVNAKTENYIAVKNIANRLEILRIKKEEQLSRKSEAFLQPEASEEMEQISITVMNESENHNLWQRLSP